MREHNLVLKDIAASHAVFFESMQGKKIVKNNKKSLWLTDADATSPQLERHTVCIPYSES